MNAQTTFDNLVSKAAKAGRPTPANIVLDSDLATFLLERNAHNRPLRMGRTLRYRADMQEGHWHENGESLKVTVGGELADGQHRCAAVMNTDLRVRMLAVFGVTSDAAETIDQGAPRNAGDYLQMRGEPNASVAARIVRLRLAYEANNREALRDVSKPTNAQVLAYFGEHRAEVLASADKVVALREFAQPLVSPAVLGFAHNVLHEISPDEANEYIEKVAKGEDIAEGNPAFAVRTRLLKMGKSGAARKAEPLFVGWNAHHSGRELKTVRVTGRLPDLS